MHFIAGWARRNRYDLLLVALASAVFIACAISPPSIMDDVDGAHAQLGRNMLSSGDWVVPRLDGVAYVEKAPLPYWLIAISYKVFGVHDWAARLPFAFGVVLLCWITAAYGRWAFAGESAMRALMRGTDPVNRAGFYAGLVLVTCIGLFLFTRISLPDAMVALCATVAFWSFQRALDDDQGEAHPRRWAALLAAALGIGVMLKGLIAIVIPAGGAMVYLLVTRQFFRRETWRRLHLFSGALIFLVIAAPWHILATLRMPPYFDFTMHSGPGQYHGFFWAYFLNEHLLRFLGLRYPHDYNTVPVAAFWLMNLLWLFPWSVYMPLAFRQSYRPLDRAGRTRLLALCWIAFLMVFFSFSTTQEYYSLPIYPAIALLLGSAMNIAEADHSRWLRISARTAGAIAALATIVIAALLWKVRAFSATGDISHALKQQSIEAYTLSLGHMGDLTVAALAYLRAPLVLAGIACLVGALGTWLWSGRRAISALALMMVLFFQAARLALVGFDPYLSSRPLAIALNQAPAGQLIVDGPYYPFSSALFYSNRSALLLNGRINNLEYGSYAPDAPRVFIDDARFADLWSQAGRCYLLTDGAHMQVLTRLAAATGLHLVAESGGKFLFTNRPLAESELSLWKAPSTGVSGMEPQPW